MMRTSVCRLLPLLVFGASSLALAQPGPGGSYGPCCPLVKGQKALRGAGTVTGPRHACVTQSVAVTLNGLAVRVDALEVTGTLLVPARLLGMAGANLEWLGERRFALTRDARRVELTLGSHAVTIKAADDTQMVSWPLCPRLVNGLSYVPLRPLAEALGLTVGFANGAVNVSSPQPGPEPATPATAPPAPGSCPADRVEAGLGVTVVRSPAESAFGVGAGLLTIKPEGLAATFGARPGDVIIGANDQPIKCPKDLDQLLSQLKATNASLTVLVVARGQEKVTLRPVGGGQ